MRKSKKNLILIRTIVIVCVSLCGLYCIAGLGSSKTRIDYQVDISNPESRVATVTMIIQPPRRLFLTLYIRDLVQSGTNRLQEISAARDGKKLSFWKAFPTYKDLYNVWTGFSRKPIEIEYIVNPTWMKGRKPASFLGSDFGYLRGVVMLFSPITLHDIIREIILIESHNNNAGTATLEFLLPPGWQVISPWPEDKQEIEVSKLRNVYFGVGPFTITSMQTGKTLLNVGIYTELSDNSENDLLEEIPNLFRTMMQCTGFDPASNAPNWAMTVLPHQPVQGGSSGTNSLVVENNLSIIAHEMFRWWNGLTIDAAPEAYWIEEGFTEYYQRKMMYATGIWSHDEFVEQLKRLYITLWKHEKPYPIHLIKSSENFVLRDSGDEYENVYYYGALVASYLDAHLKEQGKTLDSMWNLLYTEGKAVTTELFLRKLEEFGGKELADDYSQIIYGKKTIALEYI